MLCDQASDRIILKSLPTTSQVPPVLLQYIIGFVNSQVRDQPWPLLLIALGCATLPCTHNSNPNTQGRVFSRVFDARSTLW
jgi:hypothetical protein